MASLRLIKRRIKSARNISQVTRALQMVSAVKMRKAQEAALAGKPYAAQMRRVMAGLGRRTDNPVHPFLNPPGQISRVLVTVIGPEKGLAGSLVSNLARKVWGVKQQIETGRLQLGDDEIVLSPDVRVTAVSWGRKAREILKKTGWQIAADFSTKTREPLEVMIGGLNSLLTGTYLNRETDLAVIIYPDFVNTMTQKVEAVQFLPMTRAIYGGGDHPSGFQISFEPSPQRVMQSLTEHYPKVVLTQIVFDSQAAEHSARMVAMKNANENAGEIARDLTGIYNRNRQMMITNEIADIVSGAMITI